MVATLTYNTTSIITEIPSPRVDSTAPGTEITNLTAITRTVTTQVVGPMSFAWVAEHAWPLTMRLSTTRYTTILPVIPNPFIPPSSEPRLSTGALIGIGVGISIAGLLFIFTVWFFLRRRRASKKAINGLPLEKEWGKPELAADRPAIKELGGKPLVQPRPPAELPVHPVEME